MVKQLLSPQRKKKKKKQMARSESDKDIDANYGLLNNEEAQNWSHDEKPRTRSHGQWLKALLYIATVIVSCLVGLFIGRQVQDLDRACARHVSHYCTSHIFRIAENSIINKTAPVTSDVDITFQPQRFNGSLLKENIYRQDASPEVDAAWEALGVNCKMDYPGINEIPTVSRSKFACSCRSSRKVRTGARPGQDQPEVWRRVSSECRGFPSSTLSSMSSFNYLKMKADQCRIYCAKRSTTTTITTTSSVKGLSRTTILSSDGTCVRISYRSFCAE